MEVTAARVAFFLEKFNMNFRGDKLVMTGGAAGSSFWPQVIADTIDIPVEAVDFPELTAYGAALIAGKAVTGEPPSDDLNRLAGPRVCGDSTIGWPESVPVRIYEPELSSVYRQWYENHQRSVIESFYEQHRRYL